MLLLRSPGGQAVHCEWTLATMQDNRPASHLWKPTTGGAPLISEQLEPRASLGAVVDSRRIGELLARPDLYRPAFQPILALETGTVVGYEALSRFAIEPIRAPDWWFASATRAGLGPELQALAIQRILAATAEAGLPERVFLSVNVSPRYLAHPAIIAAVAALDPSRLVVEITEEEPVDDYAAVQGDGALPRARDQFAVDDAGAGFASMRHVTELRPAYVKLDADLVRGMRRHETLRAFLRALNGFASEIGRCSSRRGSSERATWRP